MAAVAMLENGRDRDGLVEEVYECGGGIGLVGEFSGGGSLVQEKREVVCGGGGAGEEMKQKSG